jgi:hypothetical protein
MIFLSPFSFVRFKSVALRSFFYPQSYPQLLHRLWITCGYVDKSVDNPPGRYRGGGQYIYTNQIIFL